MYENITLSMCSIIPVSFFAAVLDENAYILLLLPPVLAFGVGSVCLGRGRAGLLLALLFEVRRLRQQLIDLVLPTGSSAAAATLSLHHDRSGGSGGGIVHLRRHIANGR